MRRVVLMILLLSTTPVLLRAQSSAPLYTADRLVTDCKDLLTVVGGNTSTDPKKSYQQLLNAGMCGGYLNGFRDADSLIGSRLCTPSQATTEQLAKVLIKYMDEHPEDLHRSAGDMVFAALGNAFPCSAPTPKEK